MVNCSENDFCQFMTENLKSDVLIEYKKEAGMDGKISLQVSGTGAMLFDGICVILKELALAEAKEAANPEIAGEYVNLVNQMVIGEIMEKLGFKENGRKKASVTELKPGQTIRFEFGAPDNWLRLKIREIHIFENQVTLTGKNNGYQDDYSFKPMETVEVLDV